jgi:hypothetical protein
MIQVVQAFDRAPISQRPGDDAATLERKFAIASKLFKDRKSWLKPHQRMDVLRKLAALKEAKREHFGRQIARESGKPYTDALIETDRAIDGVRNACDILRTWAGCEIPMGLTAGSDNRRACATDAGNAFRPTTTRGSSLQINGTRATAWRDVNRLGDPTPDLRAIGLLWPLARVEGRSPRRASTRGSASAPMGVSVVGRFTDTGLTFSDAPGREAEPRS